MFRHLTDVVSDLAQGVRALLYPGICAACGESLPPGRERFCTTCLQSLTGDRLATCPRCAASIGTFTASADGCTQCRDAVFHFEQAVRLGTYEGLLRDLILRMKHGNGEQLAEILGDLWGRHLVGRLPEPQPQVVIPVPLHWRRRWSRGYNQSEVLAAGLARQLRLPCRPNWLRRIRHSPEQTQQTASNRRENVRGIFQGRARSALRGQFVLLVDDVLTTGSTASEAARALKAAGAARVVVAVLAHHRP